MKAEDLLDVLPAGTESHKWEMKKALWLSSDGINPNKEKLKEDLGKQVSAFANTSGGNLVIGFDGKTRELEPCLATVGREPMQTYLGKAIESSVEFRLNGYEVHPLEFRDQPGSYVYVIEIPDSPSAPHQSAFNKTYYWRPSDKSEPAPHFHLDNLYRRESKADLTITEIDYHFRGFTPEPTNAMNHQLRIYITLTVRNLSRVAATPWAVLIQTPDFCYGWKERTQERYLDENGFCVPGKTNILFPGDTQKHEINLEYDLGPAGTYSRSTLTKAMQFVKYRFTGATQNGTGVSRVLAYDTVGPWFKELQSVYEMFEMGS